MMTASVPQPLDAAQARAALLATARRLVPFAVAAAAGELVDALADALDELEASTPAEIARCERTAAEWLTSVAVELPCWGQA